MADLMEGMVLHSNHLTRRSSCGSLSSSLICVNLSVTWAALRFGPRGATAAFTAFSSLAIVGTALGVSSFSTGSLGERLFFLQGFMAITAVTTLILAAVMAERCA